MEDAESALHLTEQDKENRRKLIDDWKSWVARWKEFNDLEKPLREELRNGELSDEEDDYEAEEVEVEEILNIEEEVISYGFEQLD